MPQVAAFFSRRHTRHTMDRFRVGLGPARRGAAPTPHGLLTVSQRQPRAPASLGVGAAPARSPLTLRWPFAAKDLPRLLRADTPPRCFTCDGNPLVIQQWYMRVVIVFVRAENWRATRSEAHAQEMLHKTEAQIHIVNQVLFPERGGEPWFTFYGQGCRLVSSLVVVLADPLNAYHRSFVDDLWRLLCGSSSTGSFLEESVAAYAPIFRAGHTWLDAADRGMHKEAANQNVLHRIRRHVGGRLAYTSFETWAPPNDAVSAELEKFVNIMAQRVAVLVKKRVETGLRGLS